MINLNFKDVHQVQEIRRMVKIAYNRELENSIIDGDAKDILIELQGIINQNDYLKSIHLTKEQMDDYFKDSEYLAQEEKDSTKWDD